MTRFSAQTRSAENIGNYTHKRKTHPIPSKGLVAKQLENNYDDLIFHKKQGRRESIAAANSCILYDRAARA